MINIEKYIEEGKIKRDKIVTDVKRRKISKNDILELDKDIRVSNEYFGIGNFKKIDKKFWDSQYLDKLSLVSVAESFNKEYLLYLSEVANYIENNKIQKENIDKSSKRFKLLVPMSILFTSIILTVFLKKK